MTRFVMSGNQSNVLQNLLEYIHQNGYMLNGVWHNLTKKLGIQQDGNIFQPQSNIIINQNKKSNIEEFSI